MRQLYSISVSLYNIFLRLVSFFNQKARDWFYGRREIFTKLSDVFTPHHAGEQPAPIIWIHCASLGEYEQGRPIIQDIKKKFPGFIILLTFFSPSGYNNKANSSEADYVFYLPIDSLKNARRFIKIVSPSLAIFVKYEFWYNYLNELFKNKIPVYTVSAIFRPDQHFFKWYGGWFRTHLRKINRIFVQDSESAELLNMIDINNVTVSGDTRFDRVSTIADGEFNLHEISDFTKDIPTIVAGSTWPPDEELLSKLYEKLKGRIRIIIAPHEVNSHHINELKNRFKGSVVLYSEFNDNSKVGKDILIIDSIGLLSKLYHYATITYVGGGFGVGIHNTLEAAVYGKPVLFGPNYRKFKEANELVHFSGAVPITSASELIDTVSSFLDSPEKLMSYSDAAGNYVKERKGATELVMKEIENYISEVISS